MKDEAIKCPRCPRETRGFNGLFLHLTRAHELSTEEAKQIIVALKPAEEKKVGAMYPLSSGQQSQPETPQISGPPKSRLLDEETKGLVDFDFSMRLKNAIINKVEQGFSPAKDSSLKNELESIRQEMWQLKAENLALKYAAQHGGQGQVDQTKFLEMVMTNQRDQLAVERQHNKEKLDLLQTKTSSKLSDLSAELRAARQIGDEFSVKKEDEGLADKAVGAVFSPQGMEFIGNVVNRLAPKPPGGEASLDAQLTPEEKNLVENAINQRRIQQREEALRQQAMAQARQPVSEPQVEGQTLVPPTVDTTPEQATPPTEVIGDTSSILSTTPTTQKNQTTGTPKVFMIG